MRRVTGWPAAAALLGLCFSGAGPAHAQDRAILKKVTNLNKQAVEAYDNLDIEEAAKLLQRALELCAAEGFATHQAKARTHVNLGVVLVGGLKQRDLGVQQFQRALEIDPTIKPSQDLLNPEIQAAFDGAAQQAQAVRPPVPPPEPGVPPALPPQEEKPTVGLDGRPPKQFKGLFHEPVTEAEPGWPITIKAVAEQALGADKLVLAYRPEGATKFLARDMKQDSQAWFVATIPDSATAGNVVAYYVEARDPLGQALAASGSAQEPHVVSLAGAAESAQTSDTLPEAALRLRPKRAPRFDEASLGADAIGTEDPSFWLVLGVGGGGGYASGQPEVNPTDRMGGKHEFTGFAPANLLHLAPEIGYFTRPDLVLSLQGRIQLVTGATEIKNPACAGGTCAPAKAAVALLAKAIWLFGEPGGLRPFASVVAGGGEIRHLVSIPTLTDCGTNRDKPCVDTVVGGPFLFGGTAGVSYDLLGSLAVFAGLNALAGAPKIMLNFDVNLGLVISI